jgi:hypothetical protein
MHRHVISPVTARVSPVVAVQSVTLTEIEQAMRYWRCVARRNGWEPFSTEPLRVLETRYRHLVTARCGAIAFGLLSPDERQAMRLWRKTLRDEE